MSTRRAFRRHGRRVPLEGALVHFLLRGCWAIRPADLDVAILMHKVLQGGLRALLRGEPPAAHMPTLAAIWEHHRASVKAQHPARTFAEAALAGSIPRRDPENPGIITWVPFDHCPEHPPLNPKPRTMEEI